MFSIKFIDEHVPDAWLQPDEKALLGEITIGDFHERFKISTRHWSKQDYIKHWVEACHALISGQAEKTILCTDIADTTKVGYSVGFWALYREQEKIYIYNIYQPSDGRMYSTDLDELVKLLPERTSEGAEWEITVNDLQQWLESMEL